MSPKLKRISENKKLIIMKLIDNASLNEVKYIESFLINKMQFNNLLNVRSEKEQLSLYDLNGEKMKEFSKLIDCELNLAIKEKKFEIIDREKTAEMLNNLNIPESFKFNYTHVESIVGLKSVNFNIVSRWSKEQLDYIIELAKRNNTGTNYDTDLKKLNEMCNTNYSKQNVSVRFNYQFNSY